MRYVLEREAHRGSTPAISVELSKGGVSVSDLCREFGLSRPTGYRWIYRYKRSIASRGAKNRSSR
ncbi:MAG TPA: helix-turn-helix domain-containing protein [Edaphobacter sp.]